jgi:hypothetical protein
MRHCWNGTEVRGCARFWIASRMMKAEDGLKGRYLKNAETNINDKETAKFSTFSRGSFLSLLGETHWQTPNGENGRIIPYPLLKKYWDSLLRLNSSVVLLSQGILRTLLQFAWMTKWIFNLNFWQRWDIKRYPIQVGIYGNRDISPGPKRVGLNFPSHHRSKRENSPPHRHVKPDFFYSLIRSF